MLKGPAYPKTYRPAMRQEELLEISPMPVDMNRTAAVILGGGQGTRLHPLTETCCKPDIPFGGRYRLIDFPISNSINSGCHKIFIVTQFLSTSLHNYVYSTYQQNTFSRGFIQLLSAEQRPKAGGWFQGTADAVRQNIEYLLEAPVDYFLILSGDQVYNLDFRKMLRFAETSNADLVIASLPINEKNAKRMGVLNIDDRQFVTEFHEKPQDKNILKQMKFPESTLKHMDFIPLPGQCYLGSMGIYLFKRNALIELLNLDHREDFGKHLIPTKIAKGNVASYIHSGYWEDIGTIDSFYQANMALTKNNSPLNFFDENNPIFSASLNLPGPKIYKGQISNSIISEGSIIEDAEITRSILGPRTVIKKNTTISDSYLMGNAFYHRPVRISPPSAPLHIGENCTIRNAIIDKNASIGNNVNLTNQSKLESYNSDNVYIRDGIIIVPRGAILPEGFTL